MSLFNVLLIALIVYLEYLHYKERKDLLNRIQAKDFVEYKKLDKKIVKKKKEEEEPEPSYL